MNHNPPPARLGRYAGAKALWAKEIGERWRRGKKRLKQGEIGTTTKGGGGEEHRRGPTSQGDGAIQRVFSDQNRDSITFLKVSDGR